MSFSFFFKPNTTATSGVIFDMMDSFNFNDAWFYIFVTG